MKQTSKPCEAYRDSIYTPGICFDCKRLRDEHVRLPVTTTSKPDRISKYVPDPAACEAIEKVMDDQADSEIGPAHPRSAFTTPRTTAAATSTDAMEAADKAFPAPEVDPLVHYPPHYTAHPSGVETIDITEHFNFNRGNAIKYIWRAGSKGDEIQDLEKAAFYINREIERVKKARTG